MLLGKSSKRPSKNPPWMTLLGCVLSPLHTKSSIFPSSSAPDHVTTKEEKTLSCLHPQLTAVHRVYGSQLAKCRQFHYISCPCCFWMHGFIKWADHFVTVAHSGKQILLQVVFLTPCVHDHVTTPTRGWWKITSLQATGKWMLVAVYHIVQHGEGTCRRLPLYLQDILHLKVVEPSLSVSG